MKKSVIIIMVLLLTISSLLLAKDWPTYMMDYRRSGVTSESLITPLNLEWVFKSQQLPQAAWPDPAPIDYWHREANLKPRVIYDRAFHVVSQGDLVYFGSSSSDKIVCLDAASGIERWSFFTGGPVRLAPTLAMGNLYAGSDDGRVYCLDAQTGDEKWIYDPSTNDRVLPGNERVISIAPVRTGVVVDENRAYFCAGMFCRFL